MNPTTTTSSRSRRPARVPLPGTDASSGHPPARRARQAVFSPSALRESFQAMEAEPLSAKEAQAWLDAGGKALIFDKEGCLLTGAPVVLVAFRWGLAHGARRQSEQGGQAASARAASRRKGR